MAEEEEEPGDVPQPLLEYSAADVMVNDKRLQRLQERARIQEDRDTDVGERLVSICFSLLPCLVALLFPFLRLHSVEEPEVIYEHEEENEEPTKDAAVWEESR